MTELQKLSLKKIRKAHLPLFVLDQKSKKNKGGFVILDLESFDSLRKEKNNSIHGIKKNSFKKDIPDFRIRGLLWDRPQLTNRQFMMRLKKVDHPEHQWALKRLMEYAPSSFVTRVLSLHEIKSAVSEGTLRPLYQKAWQNAVQYWTKNP